MRDHSYHYNSGWNIVKSSIPRKGRYSNCTISSTILHDALRLFITGISLVLQSKVSKKASHFSLRMFKFAITTFFFQFSNHTKIWMSWYGAGIEENLSSIGYIELSRTLVIKRARYFFIQIQYYKHLDETEAVFIATA